MPVWPNRVASSIRIQAIPISPKSPGVSKRDRTASTSNDNTALAATVSQDHPKPLNVRAPRLVAYVPPPRAST